MAHQDRHGSDLAESTDSQVPGEPHRDGVGQQLRRDPQRKPTEIGCVFAGVRLRVGELSPDAYAALLEEL